MSELTIARLRAGYGKLRVLHGIDLNVASGERVGLVGLNGHGKSTLLRSIVGLVGWREGEIAVGGVSIMRTATYELARSGVVLIPQGDSLFPGLTVLENLELGAFYRPRWRVRKKRRDRVLQLFPSLAARLGQRAGTLSGGERRMLSVGRGLMTSADIYLVDEPSLGLAPGLGKGLLDALTAYDFGAGSLVLAEQNRSLIQGRVDRIVQIHHGGVAGVDKDAVSRAG